MAILQKFSLIILERRISKKSKKLKKYGPHKGNESSVKEPLYNINTIVEINHHLVCFAESGMEEGPVYFTSANTLYCLHCYALCWSESNSEFFYKSSKQKAHRCVGLEKNSTLYIIYVMLAHRDNSTNFSFVPRKPSPDSNVFFSGFLELRKKSISVSYFFIFSSYFTARYIYVSLSIGKQTIFFADRNSPEKSRIRIRIRNSAVRIRNSITIYGPGTLESTLTFETLKQEYLSFQLTIE